MRVSTITWAVAAAAIITATAPSAEGQPYPWARAEQSRIGFDFDYWPRHQDAGPFDLWTHVWGSDVHAQIGITDAVFLSFEVPWAIAHFAPDPGGNETEGAFGNPTVGAYWADTVHDQGLGVAVFAGGSLSVPTIHDDARASLVAALATAARGLYDAHRYIPEHVPVRMRGGIELRIRPWLFYRAELNPVIHIPTDGDVEFITEIGNEIEFRHKGGFGGGMRLQAVMPFTDDDILQLAMEPFIGYEAEKPGFFFRLGLLMALDEYLGFAFEEGKVAAIRTTFGGKF